MKTEKILALVFLAIRRTTLISNVWLLSSIRYLLVIFLSKSRMIVRGTFFFTNILIVLRMQSQNMCVRTSTRHSPSSTGPSCHWILMWQELSWKISSWLSIQYISIFCDFFCPTLHGNSQSLSENNSVNLRFPSFLDIQTVIHWFFLYYAISSSFQLSL